MDWNDAIRKVNSQVHFTDEEFIQPGTFFGTWIPRSTDTHFYAYGGILAERMKSDKNAPVSVCAILDDRPDSRTDKYEQEWNGFWQFFNVMQFLRCFVAVCYTGLDNHAYVALPFGETQTATEDTAPVQVRSDAWAEIRGLLFDEATIQIADALEEKGIAAPNEAGFELASESGEVIAELELAWIERRIGYMTQEQLDDRSKAENEGWKIFTSADEIESIFKED